MKASELAVGDWVMPLRKCVGKPCQVVSIDGGTNTCWIDSDEYSGLLPCSDLERIPLTTEILEKTWFEALDKFYWYTDGDSVVYYYPETGELVVSLNLKTCFQLQIRNVHELQHALRLCGIDKAIVI